MKKVFRLMAIRTYSIEITAIDGEDAIQIAEQLPFAEWDARDDLDIYSCDVLDVNPATYFGDE